MKILLVEDDEAKSKQVTDLIGAAITDFGVSITNATTLSDTTREIYENSFDLIVLDLCLPVRSDEKAKEVSDDLLGILQDSALNGLTPAIALTQFDELLESQIYEFSKRGVTVVRYDDTGAWRTSLEIELRKALGQRRLDFLFVCALDKERSALREAGFSFGHPRSTNGLDAISVEFDGHTGAAIKLNRMGLVECATTTARAIETFRPRVVAMSGICAGFDGEVSVGDLVVPSICWEYQTGKLTDDGFKMEPYSVDLHQQVEACVSTMIAEDEKASFIKSNMPVQEIIDGRVRLAPVTSGSAVVASSEAMEKIGVQHRKVAALEMELFALYRACATSSHSPLFYGVKSVVDLGDASKNDHLHLPGCIHSARYAAEILRRLLL